MIYDSSLAAMRRDITRSDLRFNLLRICARAPRMIHQLIHAPDYPGIEKTLFSLQSEINVTIEIGECRNRELLTIVDRVQDPWNAKMQTNLSRTTILPFLIAPEFAYAEPKAYEAYLRAWFALPAVQDELGEGAELLFALFLAFPEIAPRAVYVAAPREELPDEPLGDDGGKRLFGWYRIADLPVSPAPRPLGALLGGIHRRPLPAGAALLKKIGIERHLRGISRFVLSRRFRHPAAAIPQEFEVEPLRGPELLDGRIRPIPLEAVASVAHEQPIKPHPSEPPQRLAPGG